MSQLAGGEQSVRDKGRLTIEEVEASPGNGTWYWAICRCRQSPPKGAVSKREQIRSIKNGIDCQQMEYIQKRMPQRASVFFTSRLNFGQTRPEMVNHITPPLRIIRLLPCRMDKRHKNIVDNFLNTFVGYRFLSCENLVSQQFKRQRDDPGCQFLKADFVASFRVFQDRRHSRHYLAL